MRVIVTSLVHLKIRPSLKIWFSNYYNDHAFFCSTLKVPCLKPDITSLLVTTCQLTFKTLES